MPVIVLPSGLTSAPPGTPGQVLNPTADSPLNPDFPVPIGPLPGPDEIQMRSGEVFTRYNALQGREFDLVWGSVLQSTADALRQWSRQYLNSYFTYYDVQRNRYYVGRFKGEMKVVDTAYNRCAVQATFQEVPGLPMATYPSNWARDAVFIAARGAWGDLVQLTGAWSYAASSYSESGSRYHSNVTDATAEWVYFGYGFQYWAEKNLDLGIAEISLDGTVLGTVDLYASGNVAAASLLTSAAVPLGLHRVKVRVTGTKNASSSGYFCLADAIEVMQ
jgi:hypothetical protein